FHLRLDRNGRLDFVELGRRRRSSFGVDLGLGFGCRRHHGWLGGLHQTRRRRGRGGLGRLGWPLGGRAFLALDDRRFVEDVAAWQRNIPLACEALDEL